MKYLSEIERYYKELRKLRELIRVVKAEGSLTSRAGAAIRIPGSFAKVWRAACRADDARLFE